jgi:hypothetical protein
MSEKWLSGKTPEGRRWILASFVILAVAFSFCARLIESGGGRVKIERVTIDSRGATINANLYYPANTSDKDKLPAVLVAHGGGVNSGVIKGIADELARRGFVVLNVDAYGAGLSEQPPYDEGGQGEKGYNNKLTPSGMIDSLNFMRTLKFVDQERIGMTGHSMGSRRSGVAGIMDCGYFTFNDVMINALHDTFNQDISEAEIGLDARALAKAHLSKEQLAYYEALEARNRIEFDSRIKSIFLIGSDADKIGMMRAVKVAGHEVMRNCRVNFGIVSGVGDLSYYKYNSRDTTKAAWHTGGADIALGAWYSIDDMEGSSKKLGGFEELSVSNDEELAAAIRDRATRVCMLAPGTHSENFFSGPVASKTVKYFEQTLGYNRGELASAQTRALDSGNIVFKWREAFNFLAMISMILMIIALASLLLGTRFFAPCVADAANKRMSEATYERRSYRLFALFTVALTFLAMYITNRFTPFMFPIWRGLPLFGSFWLTVALIAVLSIGSAILLAVSAVVNKRKNDDTALRGIGLRIRLVDFLKTLLLSAILLVLAYSSLALNEYLFNQDYRFWMASFGELRVEHWALVWRYTLLTLPFFLVIGAGMNYTTRSDIPEWRDTLYTVIINSSGIWLCCLINQFLVYSGLLQGALFSSFISSYGMLVIVPVTVYITRKMYNLTNSIWLGAVMNALLISWTLISSAGMSCDFYYGQTLLSNLLG